jgi:Peptidase family M23
MCPRFTPHLAGWPRPRFTPHLAGWPPPGPSLAGVRPGAVCVRAGGVRVRAGAVRVRPGVVRVRAGGVCVRPGVVRARPGVVRARLGVVRARVGVRVRAGAAVLGAVLLLLLALAVPALGTGPVLAGPSSVGPAARYDARWGWPLSPGPPVLRRFDRPDTPYGPGHRGVDLGGAPGSAVLSAGPGVVAFAGTVAGRGVVSIQHAGGLRTTYEPLAVGIRAGAAVGRGSMLGRLVAGHPGCPWPACLHWGLRHAADYRDPLSLLRRGPVRLLPLDSRPAQALVAPDMDAGRRRPPPAVIRA